MEVSIDLLRVKCELLAVETLAIMTAKAVQFMDPTFNRVLKKDFAKPVSSSRLLQVVDCSLPMHTKKVLFMLYNRISTPC